MRRALLLAALLAMPPGGARAEPISDLRGVSVGMPASALPADGFTGFDCAADAKTVLHGWHEWEKCPIDATGHHALHFHYAEGDTKVAGHPVVLTALFDAAGRLDTLRIETEPGGPLFLRKKAFLLGLQARHRYGDDGWSCTDAAQTADEEPVGGVFLKQTCRKSADGRAVAVERTLMRHAGSAPKEFVGESRISVTVAP